MKAIFETKIDLFARMEEDVLRFEEEDVRNDMPVGNPEGKTAHQRVRFALELCNEGGEHTQRLVQDLTNSLKIVSSASIDTLFGRLVTSVLCP